MTEDQIPPKFLKVMVPVTAWVICYAVTVGAYVPGWLAGLNLLLLLVMLVVMGRELI